MIPRSVKAAMHSALGRIGLYLVRKDGRVGGRRATGLDYVDVVRKIVPSPTTIFVRGAFHGAGALHVARAFPSATVYAFEADPATLRS